MSNPRNNITLVGRITKDVEVKTSQNGISTVSFTLAVDRAYKNQNGEREADFPFCVAYRKTADIIGQYCGKGDLVAVQGDIRTRSYDDRDGKKVYVTEVNVDNITMLESKAKKAERQNNGNNEYNGYNGYNNNNNYNGNGYGNSYSNNAAPQPAMPPVPNSNSFSGMGTQVPFDEEVPF